MHLVWILIAPLAALSIGVHAAEEATATDVSRKPGAVEGTVVYRGKIPKNKVADSAGAYRDLIEVDSKTGGLKEAVVFLTAVAPENANIPPAKSATLDSAPPKETAVIDQLNDLFVPHVLAVREGQEVIFSNSDAANHNVRTTTSRPENHFNIFVGTGGMYRRKFRGQDRNQPIQLGCDIHPWMRAWVYVFSHPLFAVTDRDGRFKIPSVPAGRFNVSVVQPELKYRAEKSIVVKEGESIRLEIVVE